MASTHYQNFQSKKKTLASGPLPIGPRGGDLFYDSTANMWLVYDESTAQWWVKGATTTTSTSTSTTTTSTSTTTTSTSSSTTTSTSTSTSTSTTTTL